MTPQEKAKDIVESYQNIPMLKDFGGMDLEIAKNCAKIHVNEILNNNCGSNTDGQQAYENELYCDEYFWNDVLKEIDNL